jgi:ATP-dependent helicase/nuclease subunit A
MGEIKLISASAGSGKTYRLADELYNAVVDGTARPEAVVATTFTVKAASELRQRVRGRLLERGRYKDAERLGAARFGTVHAVCSRLVDEFAFELGLPPDLGVLDQGAAERALKRVLSFVLTDADSDLTDRLDSVFGGWNWQEIVGSIVSLATSNGIRPDGLRICAEKSLAGFLELLDEPAADGAVLEGVLADEMRRFIAEYTSLGDTTGKTRDAVEHMEKVLRSFENSQAVPWSFWAKIASLDVGKKSREAARAVIEAAEAHSSHPRLHEDIRSAIELVFSLASRVMEEYQDFKLARGVIDFPDQERYALELLSRPGIVERLAPFIDLVLVDEFQDTNPIQLAIFLRLASIARRSVWVGDQKQAIFGFRGTDPALIDAAIEEICAGGEPESLPQSWRSRPDLVRLTSALFVPAFSKVGIPPVRVALEPALEEPEEDMGAIVEHWSLSTTNKPNDALALAAAVAQLLDERPLVRDPVSGEIRQLRPGDLAILCRMNFMCTLVTRALESRGIRVCIPRPGLLCTLEGRVLSAALRLWADSDDTLAEAELAYLTEYTSDGEAWLTKAVEAAGDHAFSDNPAVRAVGEARDQFRGASPVEAFDAILESTSAVELCHRWGNTAPRMANLERLRAHAVQYQAQSLDAGSAFTIAGLARYLRGLEEQDLDLQAEAAGLDAVTVDTWHGAKGLEWPVTILFELAREPRLNDALGLKVACDNERLDLARPLAGRWLRYWPYPYGKLKAGVSLLNRLASSPVCKAADERVRREEMRLLYVGWTRARDRLVLAVRQGELTEGMLAPLSGDASSGISEPEDDGVVWAGLPLKLQRRFAEPAVMEAVRPQPEPMLPAGTPKEYPPAVVYPSRLKAVGAVAGEPIVLGAPLPVGRITAWDQLGNAVHGFFAADRRTYPTELRSTIACRLLEGWEVSGALPAASLLEMADRLWKWIDSTWSGATLIRELPMQMRTEQGSTMTGTADLVLDLGDRLVLIDHKSFPGAREQAVEVAAGYAGQLGAYRRMLETATGKPVIACYIHCPVSGMVLPLLIS